jgi:D-serine deaminase-like pyridoxal phosphate-dependent protein
VSAVGAESSSAGAAPLDPAPVDPAVPAARAKAVDLLARLEAATADLQPPFAVVDMDALWRNAGDMERRARGKPIRLASKSVRCRALQGRALSRPGFRGTLAFTLPEALWLAERGFQDVVVAYPSADRAALSALAELGERVQGARVAVMVDSAAQLDLIEAALSSGRGREGRSSVAGVVEVCIDFDAGLWLLGGRVKIGAKRSPLHAPEQAAALAREIVSRGRLRLVGMMSYEAQIAGVGDAPSGGAGALARAAVIRALQRRSARELASRRAAAVQAVEAVLDAADLPPLRFVNGGGTGSLELTSAEPAVSEIAAGSGLYGPTLFDAYRAFAPRPAALFALPVVRKPASDVATALGGGYLASGPADAARLPRPLLPAGLRLDRQEGAGEVQTPLLGAAARDLRIGDRVWFRHAKAGELCERFTELHLIVGERVVDSVPTYRGEGKCFL